MPALFVTSFGLGLSFVPMTLTAVHHVAEDRAGVASALVNTAQQIGAALGLAVFTTVSLSAADARLHDGLPGRRRDVAGGGGRRDRRRQHEAYPGRRGGHRLILVPYLGA